MKIVALSDLHEHFPPELPDGDVLVIAGDLTFKHRRDFEGQARFINRQYHSWLLANTHKFKEIITIAGNHDFVFDEHPEMINKLPGIYLQDSGCEIDGVKFWGTPINPPFCDWGFNRRNEVRELAFDLIPEDVDILISHAPPHNVKGKCDFCPGGHVGDPILADHIRRTKPKVVICGHIHEGGGIIDEFNIDTKVYNVSLCDRRYKPTNPVVVIEV